MDNIYSAYHYQEKCKKSEDTCKRYVERLESLLPEKEGNANKYLYTDGETFSWNEVDLSSKADTSLSNVDSNIDYVVESYKDGSNWYKVYKSGWCEQGGKITNASNTDINLLKPFLDTTYNVTVGGGNYNGSWPYIGIVSKTKINLGARGTGGWTQPVYWRACGFIA